MGAADRGEYRQVAGGIADALIARNGNYCSAFSQWPTGNESSQSGCASGPGLTLQNGDRGHTKDSAVLCPSVRICGVKRRSVCHAHEQPAILFSKSCMRIWPSILLIMPPASRTTLRASKLPTGRTRGSTSVKEASHDLLSQHA